jgi:D-amino-acid oxidase
MARMLYNWLTRYLRAVTPEEYIQKGVDAYWFSQVADNFTILPKSSLEPGMSFGQSFTTFCINSPVYLSYLQDSILDLGGSIIRHTIDLASGENFLAALKSLADDNSVWAYVNATGLGSKDLANDDTMFPVRGQTIYVKGEAEKVVLAVKEPMAYVIPRIGSGYSLLGGTMDAGNW